MNRRLATIVVLCGAALGAACLDMSAPKGPASTSILLLPSPSIAVGDVMRDSAGAPAMLSVNAFSSSGAQIAAVPKFFITDSNPVAHFDVNGTLFGDTLGNVHVAAQIGNVQTPIATIPITTAPTLMVSNLTAADTLRAPLTATDTTKRGTLAVSVTLTGLGALPSQGFIVHYSILFAPAAAVGRPPAVFFADAQGNPSTVDTTNASGVASGNLTIVTAFLAGAADSVVVQASASYKGAPVPGSPVQIAIPIIIAIPGATSSALRR